MFIEFCFDFWIFMVMCLWGTGLLATDFIWRSENSWQSIRDNISHRVAECLKLLADIIMRKTPGVRDKDFAPLFLSHAFGTKHRTESTDFFPESVWAQGSSNSGGLWNIFSSSHLLIFTSSHSLLLSCPLALLPSCSLLLFYFSWRRGAVPTRRQEMQPFRTKNEVRSPKIEVKLQCHGFGLCMWKCLCVKASVCESFCL